jgi:hypothetical protein
MLTAKEFFQHKIKKVAVNLPQTAMVGAQTWTAPCWNGKDNSSRELSKDKCVKIIIYSNSIFIVISI